MLTPVTLLAQAAPVQSSSGLIFFAVLVLGIGLPFLLGIGLARKLRMAEHGWGLGLMFCSATLAALVFYRAYDWDTGKFDIPLGVDLKGGVILIYEVDESATASAAGVDQDSDSGARSGRVNMGALIEALVRRVNPTGTKEIVIRPYGDQQVEIIVPEVDQRAVDQIKKSISTAGVLQFRIVANSRDHEQILDLAREQAQDPLKKRARFIMDESGKQVGLWARVGREASESGGGVFKVDVSGYTVRDAGTGNFLDLSPANIRGDSDDARRAALTQYVAGLGVRELDVLMETNDGYDVNGAHLGVVSQGMENLSPCINFSLKSEGGGARRFAGLTTDFRPEGQFQRQLGILLDNTLLSAPNIREPIVGGNGQITGQFTKEEVAFMVNILQAGSLPVVLNPNPISEDLINPLLGRETIEQGKWAMIVSMIVVLGVVFFYYRLAGFVACVALLANLFFTVAIMILIKAAFTLPGLAGLVLSVGMSVDANVLIYERLREELARGSALRMAIRNGFARAWGTIFDSNITTLLTALVLYVIGTDQVRGFAVTLIIGILVGMYTAVYCSHIVFDFAERKRWITRLSMWQFVPPTKFDFMRMSRPAIVISVLICLGGFVGVALRNTEILDIDFRGGTTVQLQLREALPTSDVRQRLEQQLSGKDVDLTVTAMNNRAGQELNKTYKVISSLPEVNELEHAIQSAFSNDTDGSQLATFDLTIGQLHPVSIQTNQPAPQSVPEGPTGAPPADSAQPAKAEAPAATAPAGEQPDNKAPAAAEKETPPEATTPDKPAAAAAEKPAEPATETSPQPPATETPKEVPQPEADDQSSWVPLDSPASLSMLTKDRVGILAQVEPSASAEAAAATEGEQPPQPANSEPAPTSAAPASTETAAPATTAAGEQPAPTAAEQPAPPAEVTTESDLAPVAGSTTPPGTEPNPASDQHVSAVMTEAQLNFEYPISAQTLLAEIEETAQEMKLTISIPELSNPAWDGAGSNAFKDWKVRISADEVQTKALLTRLKERFAETPVWSASSKIGGQVAGRMQQKAFAAIAMSFLIMAIYIWIRFQHIVFGVAAVIALLHDVAVTVAAIALSAWMAGTLDFLLIDNFKISLPVVAAFLTIIGYSINDKIVVFDRIREVRGKSHLVTREMIDLSVNQTLSRTLLTGTTTILVLLILYIWGGDSIHGFAFSLVVGVVAGTYSSVFIAAPLLLWMLGAKNPAAR